jgi:hypothetical protein
LITHLEHQKSFPMKSHETLTREANPISEGGVAIP